VSSIGQKASVSKSDFYKHFESKDDCFFSAYDSAVARIRQRVRFNPLPIIRRCRKT